MKRTHFSPLCIVFVFLDRCNDECELLDGLCLRSLYWAIIRSCCWVVKMLIVILVKNCHDIYIYIHTYLIPFDE